MSKLTTYTFFKYLFKIFQENNIWKINKNELSNLLYKLKLDIFDFKDNGIFVYSDQVLDGFYEMYYTGVCI